MSTRRAVSFREKEQLKVALGWRRETRKQKTRNLFFNYAIFNVDRSHSPLTCDFICGYRRLNRWNIHPKYWVMKYFKSCQMSRARRILTCAVLCNIGTGVRQCVRIIILSNTNETSCRSSHSYRDVVDVREGDPVRLLSGSAVVICSTTTDNKSFKRSRLQLDESCGHKALWSDPQADRIGTHIHDNGPKAYETNTNKTFVLFIFQYQSIPNFLKVIHDDDGRWQGYYSSWRFEK